MPEFREGEPRDDANPSAAGQDKNLPKPPELKTYSERPITDREFLGGGRYGDVFKVKYQTGEANPEKGKKGFKYFAEKRFKTFTEKGESLYGFLSEPTLAYKSAEKSVKVHHELKELGIPTWTTYRLNKNGNRVLMSLKGAEENYFLVLPNNKKEVEGVESDHQRLVESRVDRVENMEETIDFYIGLFKNLKKEIRVSENDAVGIVYDKSMGKIEVLFADLDSVDVIAPNRFNKYLQRQNVQLVEGHIVGNLRRFVEEYMDDGEKKKEYLLILDKKMSEAKEVENDLPQDPMEKRQERWMKDSEITRKIFKDKLNIENVSTTYELISEEGENITYKVTMGNRNASAFDKEGHYLEPEDRGEKYVFKLSDPSSLEEYKKEELSLGTNAQGGTPAPKCFGVGIEGDRAYMLLEYVKKENKDE